jgi:hypothetical protein
MKILYFLIYFCGSFLPSWIRIRIRNLNADPDPATQINADPDPATQINADPDPATQINADPQPCLRSWLRARRTGRCGSRRCCSSESPPMAGRASSSASMRRRVARYGARALSRPSHRADRYMAELGPYRWLPMNWQIHLGRGEINRRIY